MERRKKKTHTHHSQKSSYTCCVMSYMFKIYSHFWLVLLTCKY